MIVYQSFRYQTVWQAGIKSVVLFVVGSVIFAFGSVCLEIRFSLWVVETETFSQLLAVGFCSVVCYA